MADLLAHKVVSALPGTLQPSSVYFVRVGSGFDIYVTNQSGTIVSYSLNLPDVSTKVTGTGASNIRVLTQAAFDALATKDAGTVYLIAG